MFLSNRKVTAKVSVRHPLGSCNLPKRIDPERLEFLVEKLRRQEITRAEYDEIGKGHLRLAVSIVSRYGTAYWYKNEELISQAMYGIAYALGFAALRLRDNNFTPYCVACIHRFISEEIVEGEMGSLKHSTYSRRKAKGMNVEKMKRVSLTENHLPIEKRSNRYIEYSDTLESVLQSDLERLIINERLAGNNDTEIAEKLGYTQQWIQHIRSQVQDKFERALGDFHGSQY